MSWWRPREYLAAKKCSIFCAIRPNGSSGTTRSSIAASYFNAPYTLPPFLPLIVSAGSFIASRWMGKGGYDASYGFAVRPVREQ